MADFFMTHDMIRVVPKDDTLEGYLYAYLDSWVGRSIMLHNEFGVGIDHIEPEQIEDMPVVLPPQEKRKDIHKTVRGAYAAREEFLRNDKQAVEGLGSLLDDQYEPIEPEDT
jgi:type I restriction enzyme S subunit